MTSPVSSSPPLLRPMSPGVSAALNALRTLAAVYVLVHHVFQSRGIFGGPAFLLAFGQESVLVFFLLSGFVIQASEAGRVSTDLRGYSLRRVARIYPLLIAAMLISTIIAWLQHRLADGFSWSSLFGTLAALQDDGGRKPGVIVLPYLRNDPLWSLSYEVWFYALFPMATAMRQRVGARMGDWMIASIGMLSLLIYVLLPNFPCLIIGFFQIWWLGARLADSWRGRQPVWQTTWVTQLGLLGSALICFGFAEWRGFPFAIAEFPWLLVRQFLVALLLFYGLVFLVQRPWSQRIEKLSGAFAFSASLSYGIYVLHFPVLIDTGFYRSAGGLLAGGLLLFLLCWLLDRKLSLWLRRALPTGQAAPAST
jgi:peptidoglycan/LPS O-acetylase OafA/YrhL